MDSEQPLLFSTEILELDWDILETGSGICRRLFKTSFKEYFLYVNNLFIYDIEIVLHKVTLEETNFAIFYFSGTEAFASIF